MTNLIEKNTILAENNDTTVVVTKYIRSENTATAHQSEKILEDEFVASLVSMGYTPFFPKTKEDLRNNLREKIETLNQISLSDAEWSRFFLKYIKGKSGVAEKTKQIQKDRYFDLQLDNGSTVNLFLIKDGDKLHTNQLQVMRQYTNAGGTKINRYDVTILLNGLPIVQVELKQRGVSIRQAFNQIQRYKKDSFWAEDGLFEYVQLYVISNGRITKYFSNTTREKSIDDREKSANNRSSASNTFEFTHFWSDSMNTRIERLDDFAKTFFAKHTLLNIIANYCVFNVAEQLMVMRPYQICAAEKIIRTINTNHNHGRWGLERTKEDEQTKADSLRPLSGGFIWHATGSGKTLTSFKTAQLATSLPYIKKVLFVVDRKDLDYQTIREYENFQKDCVSSTKDTKALASKLTTQGSRLKDKIVVTTINKLNNFIEQNASHHIYTEEVVFIFDECHRSHFGKMHGAICKKFKKYYMFGFTGTPIMPKKKLSQTDITNTLLIEKNSKTSLTTEDMFGKCLHTYNIVNAIDDKNVLPFRVEYVNTVKAKETIDAENCPDVPAINTKEVLENPVRVSNIVSYILRDFNRQTHRTARRGGKAASYEHSVLLNTQVVAEAGSRGRRVEEQREKRTLCGFNSIFAVSSVEMAIKFYNEFKLQQKDTPEDERLKVATIFSASKADNDYDEYWDEETATATDKECLEEYIYDYNETFDTNWDADANFDSYYKDVSLKMKNREIDILIVVNMFLTGFDATTLNTLWVDKNLRYHGLIQAFSRTNRILNSVKNYGNIVCFRNLEQNLNDSLRIYGDNENAYVSILRSLADYMNGYTDKNGEYHEGYISIVSTLKESLRPDETPFGEENKRKFIKHFGKLLKLRNFLSCFPQFDDSQLISERELQDYKSTYNYLYEEFKTISDPGEDESILDEVEFVMELIKWTEVNVDFILELVRQYKEGDAESREDIIERIRKEVNASPSLRNKLDLIEAFIAEITVSYLPVEDAWSEFVNERKKSELEQIAEEYKLKRHETFAYMEDCFIHHHRIVTEGNKILDLMTVRPSPFAKNSNYIEKVNEVTVRLQEFFDRYSDIADGEFI